MRRLLLILTSAVALLVLPGAAFAQHHGGFRGSGGSFHPGMHNPGFHGPGFNRGFHPGFHPGHRGFRSHLAVFFGPPLFWGPEFFVWGYPYYYPYPVGYVDPPRVSWYCPDQGYYPTVQTCEKGWLRVLPGGPPDTN